MIEENKIKKQILEMIDTLLEAGEYIPILLDDNKFDETFIILNDMISMLQSIDQYINENKDIEENKVYKFDAGCESIIYSLYRVIRLLNSRSSMILNRLEFETIPLIQEMKSSYYFWEYIFKENGDFMTPENEEKMISLNTNKYVEKSEENDDYKYDLSIFVRGYNKLEYTKSCVESILEYVPRDLNYELILLDHGSSDGTKEYFESIAPTKQIDILRNGGGFLAVTRIIEGRYVLSVSNDVIVTPNAISNMLNCIKSDPKIAWVVPSTPNISNYQNIPADYSSTDELFEFCKKNNISDKFRWEQRARLCNPIDLVRSKDLVSSSQIIYSWYKYSKTRTFPDDTRSLFLRRKGYKMMLAKDSYCYHFGSVTLNDEVQELGGNMFYELGKKEFENALGVDPHGVGSCYDKNLIDELVCNDNGHVDILGINCGIGSNPLKVKEKIKENIHNLDVTIYNITNDKKYIEDLMGVSDNTIYIDSYCEFEMKIENKKFDYIIFDSDFESYYLNDSDFFKTFKKITKNNGILAIRIINDEVRTRIKNEYLQVQECNDWLLFK